MDTRNEETWDVSGTQLPIVCCSTSVIFSIVQWNDSLLSVDVDVVNRTTLKSRASLYELFLIFLFSHSSLHIIYIKASAATMSISKLI